MTGKERIKNVLNHRAADAIAVDFGSSPVSGIHCKAVEGLRRYYKLDDHPVKVHEPGQMLGLVEDDLAEAMGIDTYGCFAASNGFGIPIKDWKPFKMPWGQTVMFPAQLADTILEKDGTLYAFPQGDTSVPPSVMMPERCLYFDCIERQKGEIDDSELDVADNLEEFGDLSAEEVAHWKTEIEKADASGRAVVANLGGLALGDVGLILAPGLKNPKGIRQIAEWYMSTVARQDYIHELFARQTEIAIRNLERVYSAVGNKIDVVFVCGTDFGTQTSQFCSEETFRSLYMPYYKIINGWIHDHTTWKTFKHCCGAIMPLMESFIESGFDIINPVQIAAKDMDPKVLKERFGSRITFWGGGVDTQHTLPFGTPDDVRREVMELCEIFGKDGGFVFNTIHNIQGDVPVANIVAMVETLKEINNKK